MTRRESPDRSFSDLILRGVRAASALAAPAMGQGLPGPEEAGCPELPVTAYRCPVLRILSGTEPRRANESAVVLLAEDSMSASPDGVGGTSVFAGLQALLYAELALLHGGRPEAGFLPDAVIRSLGVPLLAGETPGAVILMGSADRAAHVSVLARTYREMGLTVFLAGAGAEDAPEGAGRLIPLPPGTAGLSLALSALARMSMIFCGTEPGSGPAALRRGLERLPAVINVSGGLSDIDAAVLTGASALGIPVICTEAIPGSPFFEATPEKLTECSLEARGIRLKPKPLKLPVNYDSAYEGERVRDPDCAVDFSSACELVTMAPSAALTDHRFTLIGREMPAETAGCTTMHLAVAVRVSGKKMQPEFESVIEHRLHSFLCRAEGVEHRGQRELLRLRISREALEKGLRLADLAEMLYYGVRSEFEPIADKCEVTFITDAEAWALFLEETALPRYAAREAGLAALTDEGADTFYSCTMCQSIAPHHCCVVTPERSGMCGALTWTDARAGYELSDTGPNRPIFKGEARDALFGKFDAVDRAAAAATDGAVTELSLYSLTDSPMTGCGRLECICCVEPFSGGVIVVDRDYPGMTPVGMGFEELADMVFGGVQTPGFMGVSRQYLTSKKFLRAEGGPQRIVWMPKELKSSVSARLNAAAKALYGTENFCDMICDETVTAEPEALLDFLREKGHPALGLEPIV